MVVTGPFDFDLCTRNAFLESKGIKPPRFTKTGTTIVGLIFKDGVVLGADTRSTSDTTVADKNCEKIHFIAPNIYCCGAGTAADTENVTGMVSSALELHRYATDRESRVVTAMTMLKSHLFRYQGNVSAALVLGGVDLRGPHLFTARLALPGPLAAVWQSLSRKYPPWRMPGSSQVYPHGSTDALPYATMGSGSLNAMAVFEQGFREGLGRDDAVALVARAIRSGIFNDLGSGSNVDVCVITRGKVDYMRNYEYLMDKTAARETPVVYPPGTAPVLKEKRWKTGDARVALAAEGERPEAMDVS